MYISDTVLILPAGGSSSRFGGGCKLLADLDGKPVFLHAVSAIAPLLTPGRIALAVPAAMKNEFRSAAEKFLPDVPLHFIPGGATRTESVLNGLKFAFETMPEVRYAAIHDAARPFITQELFRQTLDACRKYGGAVLCRSVTDTVKKIDVSGRIIDTVPRETLAAAETPQIFPLQTLLEASEKAIAEGGTYTDDAQIVAEFLHVSAVAVMHNGMTNRKITFSADLTK